MIYAGKGKSLKYISGIGCTGNDHMADHIRHSTGKAICFQGAGRVLSD